MIHNRRAAVVAHVDQRPQRHAVALAVAHFEVADVFDLHPIARCRLQVDLPIAILKEEVVHIERTQIGLQRGVDVFEVDLLGLGLFFVDVDVELRLGDAEAGEQAGQSRIAVSLVGEIFDGALQRTQTGTAAILHLQLETAGGSQAFDRRRAEHADTRRGDRAELLAQPADDRRAH